MDEIMQCSVCYLEYDTESHKPCIGKCGHSICFICANDERCEACPVCRRDGSFQDVIVSFAMMNIIEYKNKKKQEVEGICSLCKKEATELAICIDCSLKNGIMRMDYLESQNDDDIGVQWNMGSLSLDECIQQARLSSYCVACSIGPVHNGHRTSSFKNIQQTIFSKGIKEQIEGFLKSFDKLKEGIVHKLEEYRINISRLLDCVSQLTFNQFANYPKRIMEFIEKSKVLSKGLTSCHRNITNSIDDIEKKLQANAQSICSSKNEGIIYHWRDNWDKLEIYSFNTFSNKMKLEDKISIPRCSTSIVHKNHVYLIGGCNATNYLKTVEVYNLNDKTRRKLADLNEARKYASACVHKGKIVVCGGYNGNCVDTLEEYDSERNEWKIIGRMNCDSIGYRIVSVDNNLYAVGKIFSNRLTIMKFNKEKSAFETVHQSTLRMLVHDCTSFNGKIFIIGERCQLENVFRYSCNYNPSPNVLSEEEEFVMMKELDARLYSLNNQLYAIDSNSVEVFDEKNYKWNELWSKQC